MRSVLLFLGLFAVIASPSNADTAPDEPKDIYRSPYDLEYSHDGKWLAVSDRTAGELVLFDVESRKVARRVAVGQKATGVAWAGPDRVLVADNARGEVVEIDVRSGDIARHLGVGPRPLGLAVAKERGLLITACQVTDEVSIVDLADGKERARVHVPREPFFVEVTPDETLAVVGNLIPFGSADNPELAAVISLIDLDDSKWSRYDVRLPAGSTSVRELAISSDGRWAYAVHTIGRFNVPSTQLERGWVNTNALSVIDLKEKSLHASVLLDHPFEGSTDPWGVALSQDESKLWISLRGVHSLVRVDVSGLHRLLSGKGGDTLAPDGLAAANPKGIWIEIQRDPAQKSLLANDLGALHVAGLIEKFPLGGNGPRGLALSPDGKHVAVAVYYSGHIALVDAASGKESAILSLGPSKEPDLARRGEIAFHDATLSFQKWLSCSTCHPNDGRVDGLRWDLLNDGLGTPQRTRSLVLSHTMRPLTARGVRAGIEESVPKGLLFLLHAPDPELVKTVRAYLESLEPEPSPFLVDGALSKAALRGQAIFEKKARCERCHKDEIGSDMEAHDVGTGDSTFRPDEEFYTPKLTEIYRMAPFLHDGRAATLLEVLTKYDPDGEHGETEELTPEELADLIEYLKVR